MRNALEQRAAERVSAVAILAADRSSAGRLVATYGGTNWTATLWLWSAADGSDLEWVEAPMRRIGGLYGRIAPSGAKLPLTAKDLYHNEARAAVVAAALGIGYGEPGRHEWSRMLEDAGYQLECVL